MKNKKLIPWIPAIIFAAIGLIMFVINCILHGIAMLTVLQFFSCMAAPFAVPVLGVIVKKQFSPALTVCLGILVVFGIYVERVFDVYANFAAYDKLLHTNFGFIGAAMVYVLLLRWKGDKMTTAGVIVTLILVCLGLGGVWELFEYSSALFTHQDPQRWQEAVNASIAAGKVVANPMTDTMEDMLVTVIGACAFCILYLVDDRFGIKVFPKWFGSPSEEPKNGRTADPLLLEEAR